MIDWIGDHLLEVVRMWTSVTAGVSDSNRPAYTWGPIRSLTSQHIHKRQVGNRFSSVDAGTVNSKKKKTVYDGIKVC